MQKKDMLKELVAYYKYCEIQKDVKRIGRYSLYVHGYFLPFLYSEKIAGNITDGKCLYK